MHSGITSRMSAASDLCVNRKCCVRLHEVLQISVAAAMAPSVNICVVSAVSRWPLFLCEKNHSTKNPELCKHTEGWGGKSHGTDRWRAAGSDLSCLHVIQRHSRHGQVEDRGMGRGEAGEWKQMTTRPLLQDALTPGRYPPLPQTILPLTDTRLYLIKCLLVECMVNCRFQCGNICPCSAAVLDLRAVKKVALGARRCCLTRSAGTWTDAWLHLIIYLPEVGVLVGGERSAMAIFTGRGASRTPTSENVT